MTPRSENFALRVSILLVVLSSFSLAQPPARAAKPNVILVTIDTLRADHVACYGAKDVQTPTLDGLARDGVVFERAISQVPLTWPSHAAILTGTYPFQNGVQDFTGQPLGTRFRTVAQAFKQRGYATGAVVSAFVLDRSWGLGRGFDFYDDAFSAETFQKKDIGLVDRRADQSVAHAIAWLKKTSKRPFFLWLHLYDPHSPYDPPEPYRSEYKSHPYDGEIAYADHNLGSLIAWLKKSKIYDSSLIVVLSDHGESLGEHGEQEHGFFIYNSTVHIPLIVKPPAGRGIRRDRVATPVETISIAPTLLSFSGSSSALPRDAIEKQFQAPGLFDKRIVLDQETGVEKKIDHDDADAKSKKEAIKGADLHSKSDAASAYSETFYPFSSFGWSPLHSLQTGRYHYIEAPQPELYDVVADPEEKTNLAAQQSAVVAVLSGKLKQRLRENPFASSQSANSSIGASTNLSPDAAEKLRALGYMAYRSPVNASALAGNLADPKDKLWEFNAILKAQDAFQQGDAERAESLLGPVEERDPKMYIIPFLLGESAMRRQDWDRAVKQLQRCLELNPNFDNAMTGLARALAKLNRVDEARKWLQEALRINTENYRAYYQLGLLDNEADPSRARISYAKAVAIQPNFPPGQRELGMAYFQEKKYVPAAQHLEKAIALGLEDARLHNFLGICSSQTNQPAKAMREHQRAIELDPQLAEAHLNLAYAYQRQSRKIDSQREAKIACALDPRFCGVVHSTKE